MTASASLPEPLAIFDIDGTLLRSARTDEECWVEAVERTFGVTGISTDWGSYRHSTDRAILDEVLRTHLGRSMSEADEQAMLERFVQLLSDRVQREPECVAATAGSADALALLPQHGWRVAIGTGGWRRSALLKLGWAGVDVDGIPAAFAEDGPERERIIETARRRDRAAHPPGRTVYFGDGRWDVIAARNVGAAFIGIGTGAAAAKLRDAGATTVLPDFRGTDALLKALEEACVPDSTVKAGTIEDGSR